jgi:hypothetical protein
MNTGSNRGRLFSAFSPGAEVRHPYPPEHDLPHVRVAYELIVRLLGPPTSSTKKVWRWEGGEHLVVNLHRERSSGILAWVACREKPLRIPRHGCFAKKMDGDNSVINRNASFRIQHGPHVCLTLPNHDTQELVDCIQDQIDHAGPSTPTEPVGLRGSDVTALMGTSRRRPKAAADPADAEPDLTAGVLSPRFEQALLYMSMIHGGQVRKGTAIPHVAHLLQVAGIVLEYGADEDEAIAALLHDAVEDAGGRARRVDILNRFGPVVESIVADCTDVEELSKPPWEEGKRCYLERIGQVSESASVVSAADKLTDVRSILKDHREIGEDLWKRFSRGKEQVLSYYRELVEAYRRHPGRRVVPLAAELKRAMLELEGLVTSPRRGMTEPLSV